MLLRQLLLQNQLVISRDRQPVQFFAVANEDFLGIAKEVFGFHRVAECADGHGFGQRVFDRSILFRHDSVGLIST